MQAGKARWIRVHIAFSPPAGGGTPPAASFLVLNKKGSKEVSLEGAYESLLPQVKYTPL